MIQRIQLMISAIIKKIDLQDHLSKRFLKLKKLKSLLTYHQNQKQLIIYNN